MYEYATDRLADAGYEQYEISNWAKPGFECRHNLQYWRNLPYLGLGPGAHGFAERVRYWTIRSPQRYIELLQQTGSDCRYPFTPATDDYVEVSREDEIAETLMMGLRLTREGINREAFRQRFGQDLNKIHGAAMDRFVAQGLLETDHEQLRITRRGRLLSNLVFREFV
jgi:oxygen-independent coproporphyrinogen-3 oxidase